MQNALVIIPTYCERDGLTSIVDRVLAADPDLDVLVVDDNSPDGTGQLADDLAAGRPRMTVLHRAGKSGLGSAYMAGFDLALDRGYELVFEIDADGSHSPEQLPTLLAALRNGADLVIGSRWMPGGRVVNWPRHRRIISHTGTWFARIMLGSRLRDITSGYRGYRADVLRTLDLSTVHSHGYSFQIEMAWLVERSGREVAERPITFVERTTGTSKMSLGIVLEAMWRVTVWGLRHRTATATARIRRRRAPAPLR
ncbi:polyprenol monophosphomannose synthase [Planctomonas psychrotolerans]|uniref:polyprenol monophosphomannose synthase n=1 Tax=Planctomonas psychrotolerans TaxID=2528712 RepID=UPI001D0D65FA|nr:polyprenol monophosphomannose synthase [Planctomonas psychrotolerans]